MYHVIIEYTDGGSSRSFEDGILFSGLRHLLSEAAKPDAREILTVTVYKQ